VTFQVTAPAGISGSHVNTATVEGFYVGGSVTDTDSVPVTVVTPTLSVVKTLVAHERDTGLVTFTISVINTGISTLDVVPLQDVYDATYLGFATASPLPDEPTDDGRVDWYDLTAPAPNGFGVDLLPGERFTVTVVFGIVSPITSTTNTAIVANAIDVYNTPANDDSDDAVVIDVPTGIDLLYWRAKRQPDGVLLEWATAVEIDNYVFSILRAPTGDLADAVEIGFVPAEGTGSGGGAAYRFVDGDADPSLSWTYWLVDVDRQGTQTVHGPITVDAEPLIDLYYRIYLPMFIR
jgi:hypothetical protein